MKRFVVGFIAVICATATASASNDFPTSDESALIRLICKPQDTKGATCLEAINFPRDVQADFPEEGTRCFVSIERSYPIMAENKHYIVAPYRTDCAGHPDLGGGSLLARRDKGGSLHFLGYWPGKRASDDDGEALAKHCAVLKRSAKDERLYCLSYYRSTGSAVSWLVSFGVRDGRLLSETSDLRLDKRALVAGSVDMGAYTFTCDDARGKSVYFRLSHLVRRHSSPALEFTMIYADVTTVRRACRPQQAWPLDVKGRPIVGAANVPATELHSGRFGFKPPIVFQLSDDGYHQ
ncbi:hypothetical protein [Labrys monachus]|uniref:Uncharacterized protein n=1 Tax=Labrys monachus TaxID=217067 RepID=A0ABU0FCM9_9HYPH|nr:hypothetical protein [Labrys monachus]MDQ0392191.1 hypothetical protein [Labrys monachus]